MAKGGSVPADSFRCATAEFEDIAQPVSIAVD
jgi:hypothetical protein